MKKYNVFYLQHDWIHAEDLEKFLNANYENGYEFVQVIGRYYIFKVIDKSTAMENL